MRTVFFMFPRMLPLFREVQAALAKAEEFLFATRFCR
jgi:hypothetical protein